MIGNTTYPAAISVAPVIENHFAQHFAEARQLGKINLAPEPPAHLIQKIIDIAFWASLRREEGHLTKISLAFLNPEEAGQIMQFAQQFPLTPDVLIKLAPAVERPGLHLGVWSRGDELYVWGATRTIPGLCFVLEVVEPGLLVIKHRRLDGFGKFANVAVLKGEQIKIIDEHSASLADCPDLITSLLGFTNPSSWNYSVNVLIQLAISMRAHGRGGSLLVVPHQDKNWRESIIQPIAYSVSPAYTGLSILMQQDLKERSQNLWLGALKQAVEGVAGVTAVDGATVISDRYELLAFGAKIGRPEGSQPVSEMMLTEPIIGGDAKIIHPAKNGGTRHLSAAQFVHDQRNALALVASQDGKFTIFAWSPCEMMVHAHRVDTLLL